MTEDFPDLSPADPGGPQRNPAGRRAVLFLAMCVLTALIWPLDARISEWFERHRLESANHTIVRATSAWTLGIFTAVFAGWLAFRRRAGEAALVVVTAAVTLGIGSLLKVLIGRRRPYESLQDFVSLTTADDASFPSNHTSGAFAVCLVLSVFLPRLRPLFLVFAAFIAFTRLYVGVHYFSDVCGGLALAMGTTTVAFLIVRPRPQS